MAGPQTPTTAARGKMMPPKSTLRSEMAALRQSEERYRRLTEGLTDYVYTVRLEHGRPVQTTHGSACVTVTGYTAEEFVADPYLWIMMVLPEDRGLVSRHAQTILDGHPPPPLEHRIVRKDGYVRWVRDVTVLNFDEHGRLESYDGLIKDITEAKMAEEALRESEDIFKTLAEQCPISIMRFDAGGRVTFVNDWHMAKFARNVLGKEYFLGKLVHELPGLVRAGVGPEVAKILRGENIDIDEVFFPEFAAGGSGWVSIRGVPVLRDGQVTGGILIRDDLSQRKRVEEELKSQQEQLRRIIAEKDRFLSILAHDLKGPLSGFLGLTRMFAADTDSLTLKEFREATVLMQKSAEAMFALLENLLHWAKAQRGLVEYEPVRVSVHELTRSAVGFLQAMVRHKAIFIEDEIPADLCVEVDKAMIGTVLRNLLSNAIKFTSRGGRIHLEARRQDREVIIAVRDSGIGMDSEMLGHLFSLEHKTSRPGTEGEKSSGLGLLLCHELVARHGGRIWAESRPGQGSVFRFTVPLGQASIPGDVEGG